MDQPFTASIVLTLTRSETGAHLRMADELAHDAESSSALDCWCRPRFYRVCSECESEPMAGVDIMGRVPPHPGCWACTNGLVEVSRIQAEHIGMALVVVHR